MKNSTFWFCWSGSHICLGEEKSWIGPSRTGCFFLSPYWDMDTDDGVGPCFSSASWLGGVQTRGLKLKVHVQITFGISHQNWDFGIRRKPIFFSLIICAKCQAKVMLRSEDMSVNVVNHLKFCIHNFQVISSDSLLFCFYLLGVELNQDFKI